MKKYYDILNVSTNASQEEIKKAYKKRCFETHPDRNNGDDKEFLKVQEAYNVLTGRSSAPQNNQNYYNPFENMPQGFNFHFEDLRDIFNSFYSGFGNTAQQTTKNEKDTFVQLTVSIEDIKKGRSFKVIYPKSDTCQACNGIGGKQKNTCSSCSGSGWSYSFNKQGNVHVNNVSNCISCGGRGMLIQDPCRVCGTSGKITTQQEIKFEIKQRNQ